MVSGAARPPISLKRSQSLKTIVLSSHSASGAGVVATLAPPEPTGPDSAAMRFAKDVAMYWTPTLLILFLYGVVQYMARTKGDYEVRTLSRQSHRRAPPAVQRCFRSSAGRTPPSVHAPPSVHRVANSPFEDEEAHAAAAVSSALAERESARGVRAMYGHLVSSSSASAVSAGA